MSRLIPRLAVVVVLAAAMTPTAAAHILQPRQLLDPLHALGVPAAEPWLAPDTAEETAVAGRASLARGLGPIVLGADTKVECIGNGTAGDRVQVMYVRDADTGDDYAADKAEIGEWALAADRIYRESAAKTMGTQRIRFVTDPACNLSILDVVVDDPDDLELGPPKEAFRTLKDLIVAAGFTATDRKYMMFVDHARAACGVADRLDDDQAGQANASNGGIAEYGRIDYENHPGCESADRVMAHELGHTLGAVQLSAPHSNGDGHCTDEYDRMCQNDKGGLPTTIVCPDHNLGRLLDCNNDDYFNAHPAAGSYLDTHWDIARSAFLESGLGDLWGFVKADDPANPGPYTPAPDSNQNSTNAKNTVERLQRGVYNVTFTNLAVYGGDSGTSLATALGSAGEHCTTSRWDAYGSPDTVLTVRCFNRAGNPVDVAFDAAFTRPITTTGAYAYLLSNDPSPPLSNAYTPNTFQQFNSTGALNTVTRFSTGEYLVRLPGLPSDGGTVKVTAFTAAHDYCKVDSWVPAGPDENVVIRCFDQLGLPVDEMFTMVYADSQSILSNGAASAYVKYNSGPGAVPGVTNFNSTGVPNTVAHNGPGSYTVTLPGQGTLITGMDRGTVHVTATGSAGPRCQAAGWAQTGPATPVSPIDVTVTVACTDSAGGPLDSGFVLQFTH